MFSANPKERNSCVNRFAALVVGDSHRHRSGPVSSLFICLRSLSLRFDIWWFVASNLGLEENRWSGIGYVAL